MKNNSYTAREIHEFTTLWVGSKNVVTAYIRIAIPNTHDAEDVLQEVGKDAAMHFDQYDRTRPFGAWVIGISKRRIAGYYRHKYRDKLIFSDTQMSLLADACEDIAPVADHRLQALKICLKRLTNRHQQVIKLKYLDELDNQQVGDAMQIKTGAVRTLLHRARQSLGECIQSRLAI